MNKLMQDQVFEDIKKIAIKYANEEGITDPTIIGHIMHGIRLGTVRGIEMTLSINDQQNREIPF